MNDNTNLFIIISVANLIATTTLLVCVVLLMLEMKKNKTVETKEPPKEMPKETPKKKPKTFEFPNILNKKNVVVGVVFCRNCGQEYDSTSFSCPNCKTHRN